MFQLSDEWMGAYFQSNLYTSVSQPGVPIRVTREMDRVVWNNSPDDSTRCKVWGTVFCSFLLTLMSLCDFGQGYLCKQTLGSAKGFVLYKSTVHASLRCHSKWMQLTEARGLSPSGLQRNEGSWLIPCCPPSPVQAQGPLYHRPCGSVSLPGTAALCDIYTKLAEAIAVCVPREADGR